ncbi:MAG: cytochrome c oxidase subunit II, partial [Candidatus Sulfomarinibacteraceae bacterium]
MTATGLLKLLTAFRGSLPDDDGSSFWMPPQVSTVAQGVDWLFNFILAISVFFFLLIVVAMVIFVIKYRHREGQGAEESPSHNMALELTWTVIPLILVVVIFVFGFKGYLDMSTPPSNAYEILVEGQKWNWSFTYPNGYIDSNLHVPVDRPIRLVMSSQDVIHSLYIPAFRVKMDVVPGRYAKAWFEATEPGEYDLFCAEYCGTSHSDMIAHVVVHPVGEFETWLEKASNFL